MSPELRKEIISTVQSKDETYAVHWIGRTNNFMGERVNYSGWRNDKVIRLFKRDVCKYKD